MSAQRKNLARMRLRACIKVVGVGGGGGNAIARMMERTPRCPNSSRSTRTSSTQVESRAGKDPDRREAHQGPGRRANPTWAGRPRSTTPRSWRTPLGRRRHGFHRGGPRRRHGHTVRRPWSRPSPASWAAARNNLLTVAVVTLLQARRQSGAWIQALDGLAKLRESGRPGDRDPQRSPARDGGPPDSRVRGLPQWPTTWCARPFRHLRHHHHPRPREPRLRGRARGHEEHGAAVMGTGIAEVATSAPSRRRDAPSRTAARRQFHRGRPRHHHVNITGGPDLSLDEASEATEFIRAPPIPANVITASSSTIRCATR